MPPYCPYPSDTCWHPCPSSEPPPNLCHTCSTRQARYDEKAIRRRYDGEIRYMEGRLQKGYERLDDMTKPTNELLWPRIQEYEAEVEAKRRQREREVDGVWASFEGRWEHLDK